ncbi:MAG: hypothetical protein JJU36_00100 [Phycisphaeraceae bacterium]|nr:hypothetical protein [Phycisphaeraceae bacterium]
MGIRPEDPVPDEENLVEFSLVQNGDPTPGPGPAPASGVASEAAGGAIDGAANSHGSPAGAIPPVAMGIPDQPERFSREQVEQRVAEVLKAQGRTPNEPEKRHSLLSGDASEDSVADRNAPPAPSSPPTPSSPLPDAAATPDRRQPSVDEDIGKQLDQLDADLRAFQDALSFADEEGLKISNAPKPVEPARPATRDASPRDRTSPDVPPPAVDPASRPRTIMVPRQAPRPSATPKPIARDTEIGQGAAAHRALQDFLDSDASVTEPPAEGILHESPPLSAQALEDLEGQVEALRQSQRKRIEQLAKSPESPHAAGAGESAFASPSGAGGASTSGGGQAAGSIAQPTPEGSSPVPEVDDDGDVSMWREMVEAAQSMLPSESEEDDDESEESRAESRVSRSSGE